MKSDNVLELTENNWEEVISGDKPVLIKFGAEWCGPCRMLEPILETVATEIGDQAIIASVDVDTQSKLSQEHSIRNIPMTFLYKGGELVEKFASIKQKNEIVEMIQKQL